MKYIFYIFCFLFLVFIALVIKYRNPYKFTMIFGKKGSGKSTLCLKYMIQYLKKGWAVYTDIPDVKLFGVESINAKDLESFTPKKHSAIFLDEVGLTWDNRKFKTFPEGVNEWFKFQRKYKVRVYANSQKLDIDLKLRLVLDSMILCTSVGGVFCIARPIKIKVTLTQPMGDSESRIADQLVFDKIWHWKIIYLPRYFKYFDSFAAPDRPLIPSTFCDDGINVTHGKVKRKLLDQMHDANNELKSLNKAYRLN